MRKLLADLRMGRPVGGFIAGGLRAPVGVLVLGLLVAVAAELPAQGTQVPEVVSKMVSMGPDEARLTLELASGESMELTLSEGTVRMGDQVLGSYSPGDALDRAWRDLVAEVLTLEDEALLQALVDWTPPEGLDPEGSRVAERMDEFLALNFDSAAIQALALEAQQEAEALELALDGIRGLESLSILSRVQALSGLSEALEELGSRVQVVVDDDLEVDAGSELRTSLLVVDGTLEVRGTVRGDVLVVDGEVELQPGSRIVGTLSLADADLDNDGGEITGGVRHLDSPRADLESQIRAEVMRELRSEFDADRHRNDWGWTSPVLRVGRGFGRIFGTLFNVLILGLVGAALVHFASPNLEAVADVARNSTGRAAMVGFAGGVLALPVFILGIVGLAVTIIGIPAILLWVPLFPLAVLLAAITGYLAVARNLGAWLARQRYPYTEWVRVTNPVTLVFGGLLVLAAPYLGAHLLGMVGLLDPFSVLLKVSGVMFTVFAAAVGFGAVLLTRGGRKPEEWGTEMFTRGWRERRWGRGGDPEAEAFDAELAREESSTAEESVEADDGPAGEGESARSDAADDRAGDPNA